ncbi:MAG: efflux RND transporter periplasmic adaptor subunit [Synergistaceae bacterium]|jgi:RND family efflux transporter MFP subunit|nr:efflux RND transporter periplasmic adaptor subunit [Synergistaceae bacterium]
MEYIEEPSRTSKKIKTIKKIRVLLWVAAIIAGVAVMALRITSRSERYAATLDRISQNIPRSRPVMVMKVEASNWEEWKKYYGVARAARNMEVASYVREIVEAVHVDVGDSVKEGQLLISLRKTDQSADARARAAAFEEAKSTYNRLIALNKAGGVSQAEVDRARTAMISEQAALQSNRSALGRAELRSKISGIVTGRLINPGEVAEMGQTLLSIEDVSEMEAIIMVSARDIAGIGVKTPVNVIHNGVSIKGAVTRVNPKAQSGSGLYPVTVGLDPGSGVLPGANIEGDFLVRLTPDAVVIPSSALFNRGEEQFVFVAVGDAGERTARMTKISAGGGGGGKVVATSGIAPEDLLIISGNRGLVDGIAISYETSGFENSTLAEPAKRD